MKAAGFLVASLLVNAGLFLVLSMGNGTAKGLPPRETWTVREVFSAAPPPRPARAPEDAPREIIPDTPVLTLLKAEAPSAQGPAPEAFAPRFELSGVNFAGSLAIGGPPVPVFSGGGSPQGIVGGLPGGAGTSGVPGRAPVDRNPQRLLTPLPPYPPWARLRRLEGIVSLQFTVDTEGSVVDVLLDSVEGDERFGPVAVEAVKAWRYEPGLYQGRPVPVRMIQRVRFNLVDR